MSDTPEDIARRAAGRLARETDPALPAVVEGRLRPWMKARNEIAGFLQALAREGGASALIVTSRTPEDWLGGVRRLELGGLPPAEAAELADDLLAPYPQARARRTDKAFAELLAWLDGHPLSLRHCPSWRTPHRQPCWPHCVDRLHCLRGSTPGRAILPPWAPA